MELVLGRGIRLRLFLDHIQHLFLLLCLHLTAGTWNRTFHRTSRRTGSVVAVGRTLFLLLLLCRILLYTAPNFDRISLRRRTLLARVVARADIYRRTSSRISYHLFLLSLCLVIRRPVRRLGRRSRYYSRTAAPRAAAFDNLLLLCWAADYTCYCYCYYYYYYLISVDVADPVAVLVGPSSSVVVVVVVVVPEADYSHLLILLHHVLARDRPRPNNSRVALLPSESSSESWRRCTARCSD